MLQPNKDYRIRSFAELLSHKFLQGIILKAIRSIATGEKFWFQMKFSKNYTIQDLKEGIEEASNIPAKHQLILRGDKGTPIPDKEPLDGFALVEFWLLDKRLEFPRIALLNEEELTIPSQEFDVDRQPIHIDLLTQVCEHHQEISLKTEVLFERLSFLQNLYEFRKDGATLLEFYIKNSSSKGVKIP